MLSILIPVYNQDVRQLVIELQEQGDALDIDYQILVYDDFSEPQWREINSELQHKIGVSYIELSDNHGRAKIRNKMAKLARYHNLLYLDGDSGIPSKDFLKNYIPHIHKIDVLYGGRRYSKSQPENEDKILHWKYGQKRESLPAHQRAKAPYLNFMSNNFLTTSKVMSLFPFDESIEGYGYEDLLFANELKNKNIPIAHIDNETIHLGLEDKGDFIRKTNKSLSNLAHIYQRDETFATRLINMYRKLKSFRLLPIAKIILTQSQMRHLANLNSKNPSITIFNLWKLGRFIHHLEKL